MERRGYIMIPPLAKGSFGGVILKVKQTKPMKYTHKQIIEIIQAKGGKPMLVRELMRLLRLKPDDRHDSSRR